MILMERLRVLMQLDRTGCVRVGKDICILKPGHLVYIQTNNPPLHPYEKYPLDNPMTWDAFQHLYLPSK